MIWRSECPHGRDVRLPGTLNHLKHRVRPETENMGIMSLESPLIGTDYPPQHLVRHPEHTVVVT